jgi:glyoxylase-like metal-dependent hydrolase (beta-lactamase superfamily II)
MSKKKSVIHKFPIPVILLILSATVVLAQDTPEYEVYVAMISQHTGVPFRFGNVEDPQLVAQIEEKRQEEIPIDFVYVKGPGMELLYGPGPTEKALANAPGPFASIDYDYVDHKNLLDKLGTNFDRINYVVIDHMCFDRASGAQLFPNATVIVEQGAFDHRNPLGMARDEDYAMLEKIKAEGRLKVVDGDYEIAPGIKLYYAPGHTFATNFMTVNTKDGTIIVTGSSCYTYLNLEYNLLPSPPGISNADLLLQSYERIREVMGPSDAILIPGHDMEVYERFTSITDRIVKVELNPTGVEPFNKMATSWGEIKAR